MTLNPLFPTEDTLGINTDLYELTMAAAYFEADRLEERATFELFTRQLPPNRNFLVAAGLEQALHCVANFGFTDPTLSYLRQLEIFRSVSSDFFDYLRDFRFSGEVYALPEGTPFFSQEPILQVSGPIIESQVLETYLINTINFQSMVASKAARICLAGSGKTVVDFGSRRAHGPQAGVLAARSAFIGGCAGTSNVLASYEMGIPVYGTMAHSYIQFFDTESEAFRSFLQTFGSDSILLVDTYDTLAGVGKALQLGGGLKAVRLDSGDLAVLARKTRQLLDQQGHSEVRIIASGNLNEEQIQSFARLGVPIDAYGVGTDLVVAPDAPTCDLVYKLVEVTREGTPQPRIKTSEGKASLPYRKQIFRRTGKDGFLGDQIGRWDEAMPDDEGWTPLLETFVSGGELTGELPTLCEIQTYSKDQIANLPDSLKHLDTPAAYSVEHSRKLLATRKDLEKESV